MMKIGEILMRRQLISQFQLAVALKIRVSYRQKLGELLLFKGWIQQYDLEVALMEQYWRQNGYWLID